MRNVCLRSHLRSRVHVGSRGKGWEGTKARVSTCGVSCSLARLVVSLSSSACSSYSLISSQCVNNCQHLKVRMARLRWPPGAATALALARGLLAFVAIFAHSPARAFAQRCKGRVLPPRARSPRFPARSVLETSRLGLETWQARTFLHLGLWMDSFRASVTSSFSSSAFRFSFLWVWFSSFSQHRVWRIQGPSEFGSRKPCAETAPRHW